MKLNIAGCHAFIERKGIGNYRELSQELGLSVTVLLLLEQGNEIGYDAVRDLYNSFGEQIVSEMIAFGEETVDGFKSKYIQVGNRLY